MVAKRSFTLFSITTTVVVLVIAIVILLIGNYIKNLGSGVALDYQPIQIDVRPQNDTDTDKVWVVTSRVEFEQATGQSASGVDFEKYLVLGIALRAQASSGYGISLKSLALRGNQVNTNYKVSQPRPGMGYSTVITYPTLFLKIDRATLPVGTPLDFAFTNLTTNTTQTINQTLTLTG